MKDKVFDWYKQALELNEQLYAVLGELFKGNDFVTYCVEVSRWDTFVSLRVFAMISPNRGISEELSELAGTFSADVMFQHTQQETIDGFVDKVVNDIMPFNRRAAIVADIANKNKQNND